VAGEADSVPSGVERAAAAIDRGDAVQVLETMARVSREGTDVGGGAP